MQRILAMREFRVSLNLEATAVDLARLVCRAMALIVKVKFILDPQHNTSSETLKIIQLFTIISDSMENMFACKLVPSIT